MAGQRKVKEKMMKEALDRGAPPAESRPFREMPALEITAAEIRSLDIVEVMNAIIDGYSLRDIAAEVDKNHIRQHGNYKIHNGRPCRTHASTVLRWIEDDAVRVRAYEQAREMAAESLISELRQLAAEPEPLTMFGQYDSGAVQDKRTRIDALKWVIMKFKPRTYGEKLDLTSGNKPLKQMSEAQADARLLALLSKMRTPPKGLEEPEAADE